MLVVLTALLGTAAAGENLLPKGFVAELGRRRGAGVTYLKAEGAMPEGILVTADKAVDPIFKISTHAEVPSAVKKGDLIVLTVAVRGVSPDVNKFAVLAKLQDESYTGILRDNISGKGDKWQWCRVTGIAPKDCAAGSMRLQICPWTQAQQVEMRGWRLENLGP
ncbi:MAG: hypothetical protein IKC14_10565, partial [Kiritimatiellae bacterium]|nr:hypothetical protein [Kiritimatiellia bacterium]